jgi:hypothetical protein
MNRERRRDGLAHPHLQTTGAYGVTYSTVENIDTDLPPYWSCWTDAERAAWQQIQQGYDELDELRKALEAAMPQPLSREHWALIDKLQNAAMAIRLPYLGPPFSRFTETLPSFAVRILR